MVRSEQQPWDNTVYDIEVSVWEPVWQWCSKEALSASHKAITEWWMLIFPHSLGKQWPFFFQAYIRQPLVAKHGLFYLLALENDSEAWFTNLLIWSLYSQEGEVL